MVLCPDDTETPLFVALTKAEALPGIFLSLVEAGADLKLLNKKGNNILHEAASRGFGKGLNV